ncbi:MAG: hypothetical protein V4510_08130 [bacterium]
MAPLRAMTVLAVLAFVAPAATAHSIQYNTGIPEGYQAKFSFGFLYEPVSTFQKTGLDLGVMDAKGHAITGLDGVDSTGKPLANPPMHVLLTFGDRTLDLTGGLIQQTDRPGWYTYPLTLTKAGTYKIHITGMVNHTSVDFLMSTHDGPAHDVTEGGATMWPNAVSTEDTQAKDISDLKSQVATLQGQVQELQGSKKSPGFDGSGLFLGFLGLAGLAAVRRRRAA